MCAFIYFLLNSNMHEIKITLYMLLIVVGNVTQGHGEGFEFMLKRPR